MKTNVLIIGAGPYGISLAQELYDEGVDFAIVGKAFSLWFEHTQEIMSIRSDWHSSEIYSRDKRYEFRTFLRKNYPDQEGEIIKKRIPVSIFRAYLKHVLARLPFSVHHVFITNVKKTENGYKSTTSDGTTIFSRALVIATGIEPHKYIPEVLKQLPKEMVIHTWEVDKLESLEGKRVLVIGSGQSAGEAIAGLYKKNSITWLYRNHPVFFSEPINLPTILFKLVLLISPMTYFIPQWLRRIVGKKFVQTTITPDMKNSVMNPDIHMVRADVNEIGLVHNSLKKTIVSRKINKAFDCIIAATGYRYSLQSFRFFEPDITNQIKVHEGIVSLTYNFESTLSNVYMIGGIAEPSHGPAQRFIMGVRHAARRVSKKIRGDNKSLTASKS